jgi:hypothetical protein
MNFLFTFPNKTQFLVCDIKICNIIYNKKSKSEEKYKIPLLFISKKFVKLKFISKHSSV